MNSNAFAIACPIYYGTPTYDRTKVLNDLRKAGATRILLHYGPVKYAAAEREKNYERLAQEVAFFKANRIEVWYWRWTFWVEGENPFTHMESFRGRNPVMICPLDPEFQEFVRQDLKRIAQTGVDGILYDDDFRFDNWDAGIGCLCPHHRRLAEEKLGEKIDLEGLEDRAFGGKPNPIRSVLLRTWGESLETFARISRAAVDEVNPEVRLGMCSCITSFDGDGTTTGELARILAGKTRPYVRLSGAPYWTMTWGFKIRLPEIIEFERMHLRYLPEGIETFSEGDPFPRPRFHVASSYLELFDSALRFTGGFDGIQKYLFDYTSSSGYETGYLKMQRDNQKLYQAISRMTSGLPEAGIRVWQEMHTLENADFSDLPEKKRYFTTYGPMPYSQAAWALAAHGIPSVHHGPGCAAIVFGESGRTLPEEFRARPVIMDIQAARLLTERGWDVGLRHCGARVKPETEAFRNGEVIALRNEMPGSREVTLSPKAKVLSRFPDTGIPASWTMRTPSGENFLVFNFEGTVSREDSYRNYARAEQIRKFLTSSGVRLPAAVTSKNPDVYLQGKTDGKSLAIGIWNCSPDYASPLTISLDDTYRKGQFAGCQGKLAGNKLIVQHLAAFSFAIIKLTR